MSDRVRFTGDIIEDACGDHPRLHVVSKGTEGEVLPRESGHWPLYVRLKDGTVVGCTRDEVIAVPREPVGPAVFGCYPEGTR